MEFTVIESSRRRRVAFRWGVNGLEVLTPPGRSRAELAALVAAAAPAIEKLRRRTATPVERRFAEGELFPLFTARYPLRLSVRVLTFAGDAFVVPAGAPEQIKNNLEILYRRLAAELLRAKCEQFGAPAHLRPDSVGVTAATTRWGSCNNSGHLSFCWKLLLLPEELADYVVCHELAHLRELNHSARFWRAVGGLCPDYAARRARLTALPEQWP